MERKGKSPRARTRPATKDRAPAGKTRAAGTEEFPQDDLTVRAKKGDAEAFLSLVRFHSTFNPIPLSRDLVMIAGLDEATRQRLLARMQRKEDRLLRPFPGVNMMFWGERWVQKAPRPVPDEDFLHRLWNATREGAMLQLKIYKKAKVTPSDWVRVKYPHFANLGLSESQMLKMARAEGCDFGEEAFCRAVRRYRGRA
jgi:hypothetical protein